MWIIILCLKIFGIVLFAILLLLLIVALYLLFAPFSYRTIFARENDKISLWLIVNDWLSIGRIKVGYEDGKKKFQVSLLWGAIRRNTTDTVEEDDQIHKENFAGMDQSEKPVSENAAIEENAAHLETEDYDSVSKVEDVGGEWEQSETDDGNQNVRDVVKQIDANTNVLEATDEDTLKEPEEPKEPDQRMREPRPPRETGDPPSQTKEAGRLAKMKKLIAHSGNQRAFRLLCRGSIKILFRIKPVFEETDTQFALGEPDLTGELLGVIAFCPSVYNDNVSIKPDFSSDKAYFTGKISLKGSLQLYYIVFFALQVLLNRDCRRLYRQVRNL